MTAVSKAAVQTAVDELEDGAPVPMHLWGKDHFSTLGYLECRAVDNKGLIDFRHMRGRRGVACNDYPTRLAQGVELSSHSDWDCMDDLEEAGLIRNLGSAINPVIRMTEKGALVAAALREHKASGGSFGNFSFQV